MRCGDRRALRSICGSRRSRDPPAGAVVTSDARVMYDAGRTDRSADHGDRGILPRGAVVTSDARGLLASVLGARAVLADGCEAIPRWPLASPSLAGSPKRGRPSTVAGEGDLGQPSHHRSQIDGIFCCS
ncbi:hypothetical protein NL676_014941 [Syzygium grande]|nr:hypothetical protein NL676_014941 [Syzygium grande]